MVHKDTVTAPVVPLDKGDPKASEWNQKYLSQYFISPATIQTVVNETPLIMICKKIGPGHLGRPVAFVIDQEEADKIVGLLNSQDEGYGS